MDPVTAFSLASNILQIIELGKDTAKAFHDIYKSGSGLTSEAEQSDQQTRSLRTSSSQIQTLLSTSSTANLTPEQAQLHHVARDCEDIARTIVDRFDKLKLTGRPSICKVLSQWYKFMREKGKIEEDQAQLRRYRELLDTQMLVNIW